jgi:hypothetical protein
MSLMSLHITLAISNAFSRITFSCGENIQSSIWKINDPFSLCNEQHPYSVHSRHHLTKHTVETAHALFIPAKLTTNA